MGEGGGGWAKGHAEGRRSRDGGREAEGGRLLSDGRDGKRENAGVRGDSIMMQRWRGGGTLELARALAIGRSANHSFGNNRLHTLHTKDTREQAKNCPEWGCSLGSDRRRRRPPTVPASRDARETWYRFAFVGRVATKDAIVHFFFTFLRSSRFR